MKKPSYPTPKTVIRRSPRVRRRIFIVIASVLTLVLGGTAAIAYTVYHDVANGIHRSDFSLPGADGNGDYPQNTEETNILIMGLDSRLDQNGEALPSTVYEALHAGDETDGGYNANVLMLVHVPAHGGKAVGISIPRDNYVEISGAPMGVTHSKIKEAYGLALSEKLSTLAQQAGLSDDEAYQQARAAGRQAQISTVSHFLGDVPIDHFIEMTMAGFYSIAQTIAPVQVCLLNATEDAYSGADFRQGIQELSAEQAMSFVRQRRDTGTSGVELTDLDRTRRQQAFLVSLGVKLTDKGTLTNVGTLKSLLDVVKEHVALDTQFDLLSFASTASDLARGNLSFVTLPIDRFSTVNGSSVNLVDLDEIHSMVRGLLHPTDPTQAAGEPADTPDQSTGQSAEHPSIETPPAGANQPSSSADGTTEYENWEIPLNAGSLPCVN